GLGPAGFGYRGWRLRRGGCRRFHGEVLFSVAWRTEVPAETLGDPPDELFWRRPSVRRPGRSGVARGESRATISVGLAIPRKNRICTWRSSDVRSGFCFARTIWRAIR